MPSFGKVSVARPSAPVVAPRRSRRPAGSPFDPSVTFTCTGWPVTVAGSGPVSFSRTLTRERVECAHSTSCPGEHRLLAAATCRRTCRSDQSAQYCAVRVDLLVGHPLEEVVVDRRSAVVGRPMVKPAASARHRARRWRSGRGDGLAPSFVPSHVCVAAGRRGHVVTVGRHGPSKIVLVGALHAEVHGRRARPAPREPRPGQSRASAAESAVRRRRSVIGATPSSRVVWAFGRSEVSWLRAPRRAFPESRRLPSGFMRRISARSQWRDRAGFTPDFPRPPAVEREQHTPPAASPPAAARIARRTRRHRLGD